MSLLRAVHLSGSKGLIGAVRLSARNVPGGRSLAGLIGTVPVTPDRARARAWAAQELARREYQAAKPGPVTQAISWMLKQLKLIDFGGGAPGPVGLAVVALVFAAVAYYLIRRSGGLHRTARRDTIQVLPGRNTTAAQHRQAANRHATAQEWDLAVVERFRAIARELEERALISPQPGRTAVEVARDGGAALPALAGPLLAAARSFDDVSYGHLNLRQDADQALHELDDRLRSATPAGVR